ncbi:kita-kyushu lung cancer antigen 1 homolog [Octodon degus]|uniref:Kita-kyushu lung cancer antigen 1 homolog n=1 Tax=Octodon degus TaxID=10160 RepID=A0A6P3F6S0_OCTDE|nr:kita-kyushu lung cancer antigen 1 homolog [Octodon degus]
MTIFLFLVSGAVFGFIFVFWKNRVQEKRTIGDTSSNSTAFTVVKATSSFSHRMSANSPSVCNLSQDIINNFPHSMGIHKRILVNLKVMQHQLVELEQHLILKGLNGALVKQKYTKKVTRYSESAGSQ